MQLGALVGKHIMSKPDQDSEPTIKSNSALADFSSKPCRYSRQERIPSSQNAGTLGALLNAGEYQLKSGIGYGL